MSETNEFADPDLWVHLTGALLKNRYRVVSLLGKSGFAFIYLGMDERQSGAKVVVKVAHPELAARDKFKECFEREVGRLMGLELPHLVRVLDLGDFRGMPLAVVEYATGGNLLDRFAAGAGGVQPAEVVQWFPSIAQTLDWLHERGFVHRDVKPENILFDHSGRAMLSDLAMSKVLQSVEARGGSVDSIVGSPPYMAPEALRFSAPEPAYDQYSLGVVLYQALCGRLPHDWDTPLGLLTRKLQEPPKPLQDFARSLPDEAARAVMRALSVHPEDRFESCTELVAAFGEGVGTQRFIAFLPKMPDQSKDSPFAVPEPEQPAVEPEPVQVADSPSSKRAKLETTPGGIRRGLRAGVLSGAVLLVLAAVAFGPVTRLPELEPEEIAAPATETPQLGTASPPSVIEAPTLAPVDTPVPPTPVAEPSVGPAPPLGAAPAVQTTDASPQVTPSTEPAADVERAWRPLILGPTLPDWLTEGQTGWSVKDNILTVQTSTVLVTSSSWRNVAFTLKARTLGPGTRFGIVVRAQAGGRAVRLELEDGKGILRSGDNSTPIDLPWTHGEWHQMVLIASDQSVLAYFDKKKAAAVADTETEGPGRLGLYCKSGLVEARVVYMQALD